MSRPVERWLGTFMCAQYSNTFEAHGYKTLQSVCQLDFHQLGSMGVIPEHFDKIMENVSVLRQSYIGGGMSSATEANPRMGGNPMGGAGGGGGEGGSTDGAGGGGGPNYMSSPDRIPAHNTNFMPLPASAPQMGMGPPSGMQSYPMNPTHPQMNQQQPNQPLSQEQPQQMSEPQTPTSMLSVQSPQDQSPDPQSVSSQHQSPTHQQNDVIQQAPQPSSTQLSQPQPNTPSSSLNPQMSPQDPLSQPNPHIPQNQSTQQQQGQHLSQSHLNQQQHNSSQMSQQQLNPLQMNPQHSQSQLNPLNHSQSQINPQLHSQSQINPQHHNQSHMSPQQQHNQSQMNHQHNHSQMTPQHNPFQMNQQQQQQPQHNHHQNQHSSNQQYPYQNQNNPQYTHHHQPQHYQPYHGVHQQHQMSQGSGYYHNQGSVYGRYPQNQQAYRNNCMPHQMAMDGHQPNYHNQWSQPNFGSPQPYHDQLDSHQGGPNRQCGPGGQTPPQGQYGTGQYPGQNMPYNSNSGMYPGNSHGSNQGRGNAMPDPQIDTSMSSTDLQQQPSPQQVADSILQMAQTNFTTGPQSLPTTNNKYKASFSTCPGQMSPSSNMAQNSSNKFSVSQPQQPPHQNGQFQYPNNSSSISQSSPMSPIQVRSPASVHSNQSLPSASPGPVPNSVNLGTDRTSLSSSTSTAGPSPMVGLRSPNTNLVGMHHSVTSPANSNPSMKSPLPNFQSQSPLNTGNFNDQLPTTPMMSPVGSMGSYSPSVQSNNQGNFTGNQQDRMPESSSARYMDLTHQPRPPMSVPSSGAGYPQGNFASSSSRSQNRSSNPLQSLQDLVMLPEGQVVNPKTVVNESNNMMGPEGMGPDPSMFNTQSYDGSMQPNMYMCSPPLPPQPPRPDLMCTDGKHCGTDIMDSFDPKYYGSDFGVSTTMNNDYFPPPDENYFVPNMPMDQIPTRGRGSRRARSPSRARGLRGRGRSTEGRSPRGSGRGRSPSRRSPSGHLPSGRSPSRRRARGRSLGNSMAPSRGGFPQQSLLEQTLMGNIHIEPSLDTFPTEQPPAIHLRTEYTPVECPTTELSPSCTADLATVEYSPTEHSPRGRPPKQRSPRARSRSPRMRGSGRGRSRARARGCGWSAVSRTTYDTDVQFEDKEVRHRSPKRSDVKHRTSPISPSRQQPKRSRRYSGAYSDENGTLRPEESKSEDSEGDDGSDKYGEDAGDDTDSLKIGGQQTSPEKRNCLKSPKVTPSKDKSPVIYSPKGYYQPEIRHCTVELEDISPIKFRRSPSCLVSEIPNPKSSYSVKQLTVPPLRIACKVKNAKRKSNSLETEKQKKKRRPCLGFSRAAKRRPLRGRGRRGQSRKRRDNLEKYKTVREILDDRALDTCVVDRTYSIRDNWSSVGNGPVMSPDKYDCVMSPLQCDAVTEGVDTSAVSPSDIGCVTKDPIDPMAENGPKQDPQCEYTTSHVTNTVVSTCTLDKTAAVKPEKGIHSIESMLRPSTKLHDVKSDQNSWCGTANNDDGVNLEEKLKEPHIVCHEAASQPARKASDSILQSILDDNSQDGTNSEIETMANSNSLWADSQVPTFKQSIETSFLDKEVQRVEISSYRLGLKKEMVKKFTASESVSVDTQKQYVETTTSEESVSDLSECEQRPFNRAHCGALEHSSDLALEKLTMRRSSTGSTFEIVSGPSIVKNDFKGEDDSQYSEKPEEDSAGNSEQNSVETQNQVRTVMDSEFLTELAGSSQDAKGRVPSVPSLDETAGHAPVLTPEIPNDDCVNDTCDDGGSCETASPLVKSCDSEVEQEACGSETFVTQTPSTDGGCEDGVSCDSQSVTDDVVKETNYENRPEQIPVITDRCMSGDNDSGICNGTSPTGSDSPAKASDKENPLDCGLRRGKRRRPMSSRFVGYSSDEETAGPKDVSPVKRTRKPMGRLTKLSCVENNKSKRTVSPLSFDEMKLAKEQVLSEEVKSNNHKYGEINSPCRLNRRKGKFSLDMIVTKLNQQVVGKQVITVAPVHISHSPARSEEAALEMICTKNNDSDVNGEKSPKTSPGLVAQTILKSREGYKNTVCAKDIPEPETNDQPPLVEDCESDQKQLDERESINTEEHSDGTTSVTETPVVKMETESMDPSSTDGKVNGLNLENVQLREDSDTEQSDIKQESTINLNKSVQDDNDISSVSQILEETNASVHEKTETEDIKASQKRKGRPPGSKNSVPWGTRTGKQSKRAAKRAAKLASQNHSPEEDSVKHLKKTLGMLKSDKKGKKRKQDESVVSKSHDSNVPRGPFLKVTGPKEQPLSCKVVNLCDLDADKLGKKTKSRTMTTKSESFIVPSSDALSKMSRTGPWICAFCGKGSNYKTLGDLFGPYYIEVSGSPVSPTTPDIPLNPKPSTSNMSTPRTGKGRTRRKSTTPTPPTSHRATRKGRGRSTPSTDSKSATPGVPGPSRDLDTEVWAHEDCIVWTSGVFATGGKLHGLDEALSIAKQSMCSVCKTSGATLGCFQKACSQKYHYMCAVEKECLFDEENFSLLCVKHKNKKSKLSPATTKS